MAFNPDVTAFDLTARSVKVEVLTVDDLLTCYGLAWGVKVIPNTTRNLDKAIGYGFTTIGIKVVFLTSVSQKFPFSFDTVALKVVKFTIDMMETDYNMTI